ncbi:MAG: TRAP transporter small permease subunit [Syntrophaceae bacterium]|nr:TRAP transporter small permease subunit [Syntrophaceae bacterium]
MIQAMLQRIDRLSEWAAKGITLAVFAMVVTIAYDVILRYVFRAPTVWQYDTSYMLGGSVIILGSAYVHLKRRHVRVDLIYNRFPPRVRLILDVVFTLLFFFPLLTGLIIVSAGYAIHSYQVKEFSEVGFWRPLMWPFRSVIPVGLALLWLQGLANFIRDMQRLVKGTEL